MFTQPDGNELTTIIVKIIIIMVVILIIGALLRSCFFSILDYTELGGGSGDWIYTLLPGNYAIIRANTDTIQLVVYQKEKNGIQSVVVDSYISAFWKDDRYIIIKQYPNKKKEKL